MTQHPSPPADLRRAQEEVESRRVYAVNDSTGHPSTLSSTLGARGWTREQLSLWDGPFEIGRGSEPLGAYFVTLRGLVLSLLAYMIFSGYNIYVFYTRGNKYSDTYTLRVLGADGAVLTAATCPKRWITSSRFTKLSLGTFCHGDSFSSPYGCPATCDYTYRDRILDKGEWTTCFTNTTQHYLTDPSPYNGLSPETNAFLSSLASAGALPSLCNQHLPCAGRYDHGASAPDGPCDCCHLKTVPSAKKRRLIVNDTWEWLLMWEMLALLVPYFVWQMWLWFQTQSLDARLAKSRESDYTVVVSGLPKVEGERDVRRLKKCLTEYASHWGEVVVASPLINTGVVLSKVRRLERLEAQKAELEARRDLGQPRGLFGPLYYLLHGGGLSVEFSLAQVETELQSLRADIVGTDRHLVPAALGTGIITFSYRTAAEHFRADHAMSPITNGFSRIPCLGTTCLDCCCTVVPILSFEENSECCSCAYVSSYRLTADRAADTADVLWESSDIEGLARTAVRNSADILALVLLGASLGIQYWMEEWKRRERLRLASHEARYGHTPREVLSDTTWPIMRLEMVGVASSIVIVLMNVLISRALRLTLRYSDASTRTQRSNALLWRLAAALITNSIVLPISVSVVRRSSRENFYSPGGLSSQTISLLVCDAVIPTMLHLMNPMWWIHRLAFPSYARTHASLVKMLMPDHFLVSERLAFSLCTLAMGVIFLPLHPFCPTIAFISLFGSLWTSKWTALRWAAAPPEMRVMSAVGSVQPILAIIQGLALVFTGMIFFRHRGSEALVFITCSIPAWAGLYLLPWYKLLRPLEAHQRRKGVRPLDEKQDPEGEASFYAAVKRGGAEFVARYGYQPPLPSFGVSSSTRAFLDEMFSFTAAQPVKAFERMVGQKHVPVPMETPKQLRMEAALAKVRPALGSGALSGTAGAAHTRATTPANAASNGDGETAHVGAVSIDIGTPKMDAREQVQPPAATGTGAAADPYYGSEWDGGGGDGGDAGTVNDYDEGFAYADPGPEYVYLGPGPEGEGGLGSEEEAQAQAQAQGDPAAEYYDDAYGAYGY